MKAVAVAEIGGGIRKNNAVDMSFFLQSDRSHSQVVEVADPLGAVGRGLVAEGEGYRSKRRLFQSALLHREGPAGCQDYATQ